MTVADIHGISEDKKMLKLDCEDNCAHVLITIHVNIHIMFASCFKRFTFIVCDM